MYTRVNQLRRELIGPCKSFHTTYLICRIFQGKSCLFVFWEKVKFYKKTSHFFETNWPLVNVKTMRKIFSNYVCFSKSPNFKNPIRNRLKIQFVELDFSKIKYRRTGGMIKPMQISKLLLVKKEQKFFDNYEKPGGQCDT